MGHLIYKIKKERADQLKWGVLVMFAILVAVWSWVYLPDGGRDMRDDILPSLVRWKSPWEEGTPLFPWATLVLMPLRLFGARFATVISNTLSVFLMALIFRKYKGEILLTIPILVSPLGLWLFTNGQTDVFVLSLALLPAGWDLLLLWKPQVNIHIFWVRLKKAPKTYILFGIPILLISFLIWGFWPELIYHFGRDRLIPGWWNRSFWPYSIPFGIFLIFLALKNDDETYGIMASPLLFPYVNGQSYIGLFVILACKWPRIFWLIYSSFLGLVVSYIILQQFF